MIRARYAAFILALTLMLGACSILPPQPKTFNQSNAYALTTIQSVGSTIRESFNAGYIKPEKAQALNTQLILARQTLNTANDIAQAQPEMAAENLEAVLRMLEQLQIELESRQ